MVDSWAMIISDACELGARATEPMATTEAAALIDRCEALAGGLLGTCRRLVAGKGLTHYYHCSVCGGSMAPDGYYCRYCGLRVVD